MKKNIWWVVYSCVVTIMFVFTWSMLVSSGRLLQKLAVAQPGIKLNTIRAKLGSPITKYDDPQEILYRGTVKDPIFCAGKRLYVFDAATQPAMGIEVYTDQDDNIVYCTWESF